MSRNFPGTEVDPSEGPLDEGTNFDEGAANDAEEQVDPSEDKQ